MSEVRHAILTTSGGALTVHLRREYRDGSIPRFVFWCGREWGWAFTGDRYGPEPENYPNPSVAKRALTRILTHERELGLHRRINRRY